jgi:colicin import membrane protein
MNQVVTVEPKKDEIANLAMITIAPEKYVAALYEPFRAKLTTAKAAADKMVFEATGAEGEVVIDITTTAGIELAKKQRAFFRDEIRLAADKEREARKAPILKIGNLLQSGYKEIESEAAPYESKFDKAIKAEEARKEAERKAKAEAERQRIAGIRAEIDVIKRYMVDAAGKPSGTIKTMRDSLTEISLTPDRFAEFLDEARTAYAVAIELMDVQYAKALAIEDDVRRIAEERAELQRLKEAQEAEAKAAKEKADQEAAAARAKQEAELQAERDRLAADQQRVAEERADIERQRVELEAAKKAAEPQPAPAPEPESAITAAEEQPAVDMSDLKPVSYPTAAWPFPAQAAPAPQVRARPVDSDLIWAVSEFYGVDEPTALEWLSTIDFEAARRNLKAAA